MYCNEDLMFSVLQNGIVTKDLSRLKMLFSEIEVSASGCVTVYLTDVVTVLLCSCLLVLVTFINDGLMLTGKSHKDD